MRTARPGSLLPIRSALPCPPDPTSVACEKEALEPLAEPRRGGDEMSRARCDQPLGVESCGQGIADALDARCVIPRGDQRWDGGFANWVERWTSLGGNATALCATNAVRHRFWASMA
jgi:hypothetical protein